MDSHCIREMVDAGIAIELEQPVWMDQEGNEYDKESVHGCKVTHKIIRPDMYVCGDEVGGNMSIEGDRNVSGKLLLGEGGDVAQEKPSTKSRKFTIIGAPVCEYKDK